MFRRSLVPALGVALVLAMGSIAQVQAFELLDRIFAGGGGCGAEPSCCVAPAPACCAPKHCKLRCPKERCCKERCCKERCPKVKCCKARCPKAKCCAPACEIAAPACAAPVACAADACCKPRLCLPSLNLHGLFKCRKQCCDAAPACGCGNGGEFEPAMEEPLQAAWAR